MIRAILEILAARRRLLLVTAATLLAAVAIWCFVDLYQQPSLAGLASRVAALRTSAADTARLDLGALYRQGNQDLQTLKERIPKRREFPRVLGEVMEAAGSCGLSVGNVTYKPQSVKGEKVLAYSVSLAASGTYAALKSFLSDVQASRELLVIDGVSFANHDPFEEHVEMSLTMTVYLQEGA